MDGSILVRAVSRVREVADSLRRRLADQSGQAMVEYSIVSWALLVGAAGLAWPFFKQMIEAYEVYYSSIFYGLNLPLP